MVTVEIEFENEEDATEFMDWMDNSGEQEYWTVMELIGKDSVQFEYPYDDKGGYESFIIKTKKGEVDG